jgi:hypothetical protein
MAKTYSIGVRVDEKLLKEIDRARDLIDRELRRLPEELRKGEMNLKATRSHVVKICLPFGLERLTKKLGAEKPREPTITEEILSDEKPAKGKA